MTISIYIYWAIFIFLFVRMFKYLKDIRPDKKTIIFLSIIILNFMLLLIFLIPRIYQVPFDEINFIFKSRFYDLRFDIDGVILSIYSIFAHFLNENADFFVINNLFGVTGIILSFILTKLIYKKDKAALFTTILVSTSAIYLEMSNSAYNSIISFNFLLIAFISAIIFQKNQKMNLSTIISIILMTSIRPELGLISIPLFVISFQKAEHKFTYFFQWLILFGSFIIFNLTKLFVDYSIFKHVQISINLILNNLFENITNLGILIYTALPVFVIILLSFYFTRKIKYMNLITFSLLILYARYYIIQIQTWYLIPVVILLPLFIYSIILLNKKFARHLSVIILILILIMTSLYSVIYTNEFTLINNNRNVYADKIYYTFMNDISANFFDSNSTIIVPFQFRYDPIIISNNSKSKQAIFSNTLFQMKNPPFKIIDIHNFQFPKFVTYFETKLSSYNNSKKLFVLYDGVYFYDYPGEEIAKELFPKLLRYDLTKKVIIDVNGFGEKRIIYEINAKNKTQEPMMYTITGKNISSYWTIKEHITDFFN